jgi:hypothetical protein
MFSMVWNLPGVAWACQVSATGAVSPVLVAIAWPERTRDGGRRRFRFFSLDG